MARPRSIEEDALLARLALAFSETGYDGASLAVLAKATGLQKASLYHRFPGGKQQMAEEVLAATRQWLDTQILAPLAAPGLPRDRLAVVIRHLDGFYQGGTRACLLNMLSSPRIEDGPFAPAIRAAFAALIGALAALAEDAGLDPPTARRRAERAVMLLQGALVLARGTGSAAPFQAVLDDLPDDLLPQPDRSVR